LVIVGRADHEDEYSRELERKAKANPNIVLTGFITGKPLQELYSHAGLSVLGDVLLGDTLFSRPDGNKDLRAAG